MHGDDESGHMRQVLGISGNAQTRTKRIGKRTADIILTALLIVLMSFQVTGNKIHEWVGIAMLVIVIAHQLLNRKWYGSLIKGKYRASRIVMTILDVIVLIVFALDTFSGMAISSHATPFLYGMIRASLARRIHRAISYWLFILMGIHLGFHLPIIAAKLSKTTKRVLLIVLACIACTGLFFFLKSGIINYMLFHTFVTHLTYGTTSVMVFIENITMMMLWMLFGIGIAKLARRFDRAR
ncbi:MAG: DUF4405 domain-containing protein [Eggerthellaceae bacterium]|nr:DUF4405 domain-containing protein [Eggerthellaceae bacterium]